MNSSDAKIIRFFHKSRKFERNVNLVNKRHKRIDATKQLDGVFFDIYWVIMWYPCQVLSSKLIFSQCWLIAWAQCLLHLGEAQTIRLTMPTWHNVRISIAIISKFSDSMTLCNKTFYAQAADSINNLYDLKSQEKKRAVKIKELKIDCWTKERISQIHLK